MPRETFETIISELDHEEDWRRMRATSTCMKGGPKAVEAIIQAIGNGTTHYKIEAIRMLARLECILLDPVYTGKTMAGLIDLAKNGFFKKDENILFVHTGGSPALYAEFNDVYRTYFDDHFPSRAFIGSGPLLLDGHFELTAVAVRQ